MTEGQWWAIKGIAAAGVEEIRIALHRHLNFNPKKHLAEREGVAA